MEASVSPLQARWERQQSAFWVKSHTLPAKHPFWRWSRKIDLKNKRFQSPLQRIAEKFKDVDLTALEIIEPFCLEPWNAGIQATIQGREDATRWALSPDDLKIFVDASYRNGNVGIGLYHCARKDHPRVDHSREIKIGNSTDVTATYAELMAIRSAVALVGDIWSTETITQMGQTAASLTYHVASDSKAAIKATSRPHRQSGQTIIREICRTACAIKKRGGPAIRLHWVPARTGVEEADLAHK